MRVLYFETMSLSLERLYNLNFNFLFIVSQSSRSSLWQLFETMKALSLVRIALRFYSFFGVVFIVFGLAILLVTQFQLT
jgi:hypothetical protein